MEGFGQTGEMHADEEAVRTGEGSDFSGNESPMQLGKAIGGTGNGQVTGRIGGESDERWGQGRKGVCGGEVGKKKNLAARPGSYRICGAFLRHRLLVSGLGCK
jgi:hypothetical protein